MNNNTMYLTRPEFFVTVADTADECRRQIIDGEVDPLSVYVNLRRLAKVAEKITEDHAVKEAVMSEINKYPRSEVELSDCMLKQKESAVKYDYSQCGDIRLEELYKQQDEIKAKIKTRETFLRSLPGSTTVADEETAEIITLFPPVKTSKTTIEVTFKK